MSSARPLRILFLHGFTQNSNLFHAKTAALRKAIVKSFSPSTGYDAQFTYLNGPHRLSTDDIPGFTPSALSANAEADDAIDSWGWWIMPGSQGLPGRDMKGNIVYKGIEKTLDLIANCIRKEGPFDGVVGFSQGAGLAAMVASLLDGKDRLKAFEDRAAAGGIPYPVSFLADDSLGSASFVQSPLKFVICYSGFKARDLDLYGAFYDPKIKTPILHVLGQVDVVVEEARGRALIDTCESGPEHVVIHPGGHFVPSQKPWLDAVVGFMKTCLDGSETRNEGVTPDDESVENMKVPF